MLYPFAVLLIIVAMHDFDTSIESQTLRFAAWGLIGAAVALGIFTV